MNETTERPANQARQENLGRVLGLSLARKLRLAWRLRRDQRVPRYARLPLIIVIAYVLSPLHILPPHLKALRRLDNWLIALIGLWLFVRLIPHDLLEEHLSRVEKRPRVIDTTARLTS
ncbi:MAG TPA: hypothetical protein VKV26_14350 [Dehalococcoidia bacterium]|nr:hypothetical protein [Dehalococcoidia bacterium]